ncbi:MAG: glycosyltransferase family 2 protein [Elainellaceae cyanobacterium]
MSTLLSNNNIAITDHSAETPNVTLVVVPRERFSFTRQSLESIYEHTTIPFKLVYVDGNSPRDVKHYLEDQSRIKGFKIVRRDSYLTPNQARNLGLAQVETPYLVFADNDIIVSPGWLKSLLQCAQETDADVVGPLMCQYEPVHHEVHFAGGDTHIWVDKLGRRRLRERMLKQGKTVPDVQAQLQRTQTELAEFHCVLVRRSIFDQLNQLDDAILCTKEHLDFCMSVREAGGTVYFEPDAVVTYVPGPPLKWSDMHFYMLRWSDEWTLKSLQRLREKWNLSDDAYFQNKYKKLGCRRYVTILVPLARKLTLGFGARTLARTLWKLERHLNRYLTRQHWQQQQQLKFADSHSTISNPVQSVNSLR